MAQHPAADLARQALNDYIGHLDDLGTELLDELEPELDGIRDRMAEAIETGDDEDREEVFAQALLVRGLIRRATGRATAKAVHAGVKAVLGVALDIARALIIPGA